MNLHDHQLAPTAPIRRLAGFALVVLLACTVSVAHPVAAAGEGRGRTGSSAADDSENPDASGRILGPVLGFAFDPAARALRPLLGIPGASTLGNPLDLGMEIATAEVAVNQNYILALAGSDRAPVLLELNGDSVSARPIEGARPGATRIALSPGGAAAAFYYQDTRTIQILSGFPRGPSAGSEIPIPDAVGSLTALAISDDAGVVLMGFSEEEAGTVALLTAQGDSGFVLALGQPSAIAFLNNSREALVADGKDRKVYRISNLTEALEIRTLVDQQSGLSAPVALAVSSDNQRAFIADSGSAAVTVVELAGGGWTTPVSCPCLPTALQRVGSTSLFLLTAVSEGPVWLLDGEATEPRTIFVPPGPEPASEVLTVTRPNRERGNQR